MTRNDNEISLIEAAEVFLADATHQASKLEYLKGRNGELEGQLLEMAADMEKLRSDAVVRNTQLRALIEETTASSKFHTDFMSAAGREFSSEAKVVEMKYQIDILQSKIRSLERDLTIQRNECESMSRKRK